MTDGADDIERLLTKLAPAPTTAMILFVGTDYDRLAARPAPDTWSPLEILAHLRASDDILSPRIAQILVRVDPMLLAFDERRWAEVVGYAELPIEVLLDGYATRREELVAMLRRLSPAEWERTGRHETEGTISVLAIVEKLVAHEAEHLADLRAILEPGS